MTGVRNLFWVLALVSLSLGAAPAVTNAAATKGKAPAKGVASKGVAGKAAVAKGPVKGTPAAKGLVKAATAPSPLRQGSGGQPGTRAGATGKRAPATASRGRVQPQYSRYGNAASNRRQLATGRTPVRQRPVYHPAPMVPTPERTKEIQAALVQRGYMPGEPSGSWDADSTAAMKRFQKDQNLEADGKLNSLSLIALGLGPKRTVVASSGTVSGAAVPAVKP